jgi:hypothetical protein
MNTLSDLVELCGGVTLAILAVVAVFAFALVLNGAIVYAAWNWLVVPFFSMQAITFVQACVAGLVLSIVGGYFKSSK